MTYGFAKNCSQLICLYLQSPCSSVTKRYNRINRARDSSCLHFLDVNRVQILILLLNVESVRHGGSIWQVARFLLDIIGLGNRDRLASLEHDQIRDPMTISVQLVGINPLLSAGILLQSSSALGHSDPCSFEDGVDVNFITVDEAVGCGERALTQIDGKGVLLEDISVKLCSGWHCTDLVLHGHHCDDQSSHKLLLLHDMKVICLI